jgi:hypothetical protein
MISIRQSIAQLNYVANLRLILNYRIKTYVFLFGEPPFLEFV